MAGCIQELKAKIWRRLLAILSSSALRVQIEEVLSSYDTTALTSVAKMIRPVVSSGIGPLDTLLKGGLHSGCVSAIYLSV